MSTPDKCPHCGADQIDMVDGWLVFGCDSVAGRTPNQSYLCRERTAHAETRKRADDLVSKLSTAYDELKKLRLDPDSDHSNWPVDEIDYAYTSMREGCFKGWDEFARFLFRANEDLHKQLTREREKWEKFREWAKSPGYATPGIILSEMNRLDAEAKEGQR